MGYSLHVSGEIDEKFKKLGKKNKKQLHKTI
jgi:hypothetical protein